MLQLMIQEALAGVLETTDHVLYLYCDGDTVFYIGRSTSPLERLWEHLGQGAYTRRISPLGALIIAHLPHSLRWQMELRTIAECEVLVRQYRPECHAWYLHQMKKRLTSEAANVAEEVLIEHYRPCLNIMSNSQGHPLPKRYRQPAQ